MRLKGYLAKGISCALILAAHCSADHSAASPDLPSPPIPGQIRLQLTLNGAPGCENCESVGHVTPRFNVDGIPPRWVNSECLDPSVVPCTNKVYELSGIAPGHHTASIDLFACETPALARAEVPVDVVSGSIAEAAVDLHLPFVSGSATVSWIVNGGANCTPGTLVTVQPIGPSCPFRQVASCTDERVSFTNLLPGVYVFFFDVDDPSVAPLPASFGPQLDLPDGELDGVVIGAEVVEAGPVNLYCSSCPGELPPFPWPSFGSSVRQLTSAQ